MTWTTAALFILAAAFSSTAAALTVPKIPQSFIAQISLHCIYNDIDYPLFNFTHYSLDKVAYRQTGAVPLGYPGASTLLFKPPNHYTLIQPFFDRSTCVSLPITSHLELFQLDFDASSSDLGKPCPGDKQHRLCDTWKFLDTADAENRYYFYANTTNIYRVVVDGDYQFEQYDFKSFDTTSPIDPSLFDVPATQPCIDLVDKATINEIFAAAGPLSRRVALPRAKSLVNDPGNVVLSAAAQQSWKAAPSPRFDGMTFEQAAKSLRWPEGHRVLRNNRPLAPVKGLKLATPITAKVPDSWDARTAHPKCGISVIRNQGSCGSCWAFGAAESLSDRFCIHFNTSTPAVLAPQYLVSCFKNLDGCDGGYLDIAWEDLRKQGTVTEDCFPYQGRNTDCPKACNDGSKPVIFKADPVYSAYVAFDPAQNVVAIQREILANGPVEGALWVFGDFYHYAGGVYSHVPGTSLLGGHAIKIIGWGVDAATQMPYWLCANSWGPTWGEQGFFRIRRGTNEVGIEDEIATGIPLPI